MRDSTPLNLIPAVFRVGNFNRAGLGLAQFYVAVHTQYYYNQIGIYMCRMCATHEHTHTHTQDASVTTTCTLAHADHSTATKEQYQEAIALALEDIRPETIRTDGRIQGI